MARRLPGLRAVRAFEAAARHMSFARAAAELCVTPAAVSQHVKALEEYLGHALFERTPRGLILTEEAQHCSRDLSQCFDRMAEIFARFDRSARLASKVVSVRVSPSFAAKWLVPRLHRFHAKNPDIDVRVLSSSQVVALDSPDIDAAITYVALTKHSRVSRLLLTEEVFPVCSPSLVTRRKPLSRAVDLRGMPLIHDETMDKVQSFPTWAVWLATFGAAFEDAGHGPRFSISSMAIQAAVEGQGVALGRSQLVAEDIRAGRLIRPLLMRYPAQFGYRLELQKATATAPRVAAFVTWLKGEAGSL
jgi:LysR family glycine cleavage system transcriptional activator